MPKQRLPPLTWWHANARRAPYVTAATDLGFLPMPLVDLAGFMAIQIKLVHGLAKHYDVPFKENIGKSPITYLLSGATGIIGVMGLGSLAKVIPGLGTLAGGASVGITAGSVTYAVGQVFARHFESGGTLLDFDPKKMRDLFKHKVEEWYRTGDVAQADASGHLAVLGRAGNSVNRNGHLVMFGDIEKDLEKLEVLPEQKAELIERLTVEGRFVCYVGDGINDAIALKKSHVSISLRGASSVAVDTAQIVLMDGDLRHLPQLFEFARGFKANTDRAFAICIVPTLIGIGGAFFLHFTILHAGLIGMASILAWLGNAMQPLLRHRHSLQQAGEGATALGKTATAGQTAIQRIRMRHDREQLYRRKRLRAFFTRSLSD